MAAWTETQIISRISTALNDPGTAIWGTAAIASQMELDLQVISDYTPQLAQATVTFAGTARELSLATLTDLLEVDAIEFPIDKHPPRYVNFSVRGGSVILDDYKEVVSTADTAYVWYAAPHTVSGTATNTLNKWQEEVLVELAVSHLMQNLSIDKIDKINKGGEGVSTKYLNGGTDREKKVMSRLLSHVDSNFAIRWPDVK